MILTVSTVVVAELAQGARARRHDREVEIDVPDACATRSIGRAVRPLHDAGNQGRWQGRCHRQAVSNPLTNQPPEPERFGVADGLPPRVGHDRRSILLNPDPAALDCPLTSERWGELHETPVGRTDVDQPWQLTDRLRCRTSACRTPRLHRGSRALRSLWWVASWSLGTGLAIRS